MTLNPPLTVLESDLLVEYYLNRIYDNLNDGSNFIIYKEIPMIVISVVKQFFFYHENLGIHVGDIGTITYSHSDMTTVYCDARILLWVDKLAKGCKFRVESIVPCYREEESKCYICITLLDINCMISKENYQSLHKLMKNKTKLFIDYEKTSLFDKNIRKIHRDWSSSLENAKILHKKNYEKFLETYKKYEYLILNPQLAFIFSNFYDYTLLNDIEFEIEKHEKFYLIAPKFDDIYCGSSTSLCVYFPRLKVFGWIFASITDLAFKVCNNNFNKQQIKLYNDNDNCNIEFKTDKDMDGYFHICRNSGSVLLPKNTKCQVMNRKVYRNSHFDARIICRCIDENSPYLNQNFWMSPTWEIIWDLIDETKVDNILEWEMDYNDIQPKEIINLKGQMGTIVSEKAYTFRYLEHIHSIALDDPEIIFLKGNRIQVIDDKIYYNEVDKKRYIKVRIVINNSLYELWKIDTFAVDQILFVRLEQTSFWQATDHYKNMIKLINTFKVNIFNKYIKSNTDIDQKSKEKIMDSNGFIKVKKCMSSIRMMSDMRRLNFSFSGYFYGDDVSYLIAPKKLSNVQHAQTVCVFNTRSNKLGWIRVNRTSLLIQLDHHENVGIVGKTKKILKHKNIDGDPAIYSTLKPYMVRIGVSTKNQMVHVISDKIYKGCVDPEENKEIELIRVKGIPNHFKHENLTHSNLENTIFYVNKEHVCEV